MPQLNSSSESTRLKSACTLDSSDSSDEQVELNELSSSDDDWSLIDQTRRGANHAQGLSGQLPRGVQWEPIADRLRPWARCNYRAIERQRAAAATHRSPPFPALPGKPPVRHAPVVNYALPMLRPHVAAKFLLMPRISTFRASLWGATRGVAICCKLCRAMQT